MCICFRFFSSLAQILRELSDADKQDRVRSGQNQGPNRFLGAPKPRLTVRQMTDRSLNIENRFSL